MNLVTAIIVDTAVQNSNHDLEQQTKEKYEEQEKELRMLQKLFASMDRDNSGTLSWEEFEASFKSPHLRSKWTMLDFCPEECRVLFDLLDDGDGQIEMKEFFE